MAGMQKWKTGVGEFKHATSVGYGKSNNFVYDSTYSGRNAALYWHGYHVSKWRSAFDTAVTWRTRRHGATCHNQVHCDELKTSVLFQYENWSYER